MKIRLFAPALFSIVTAINCYADSGSVIFGSWQSLAYAENGLQKVYDTFGVDLRILPSVVNGKNYHRVMSQVLSEAEARALIAEAASQGYQAWYLRNSEQTNFAAVIAKPRPLDQKGSLLSEPQSAVVQPNTAEEPTEDDVGEHPPAVEHMATEPRDRIASAIRSLGAIDIPFVAEPDIKLDGKIDEEIWLQTPAHDNMVVTEPDTGAKPAYSTLSRFIYTKRGLYVSAVMQQPADTLVNRLSARDQYLNRDAFHITVDPSSTGLYGYWFEVGLGGSLLDGKVVPERAFSEQWDGPWQGASTVTADGWSAELFLPWSMMAMPQTDGPRTFGFWLKRKVAHLDETYSWPALPFDQPKFLSALAAMSLPGVQPKQNFAIFPYASATVDEISGEDDVEAGFDFSYRPSSNLQITGAINPDFGAVESDDVVVNLTAFETFFPEKRLFFLEGNEVFVTSPRSDLNRFNSRPQGTGARATPLTFTPEPTTLMNTRRIGGAARHIDVPDGIDVPGIEQSRPTDLLGAMKLVGQNGALRYGMLAAFEDDVELLGTDEVTGADVVVEGPGRDFGVVRALYENSDNGRKSVGYMGTLVTLPGDDAMVHGIDAHYLGANGKLRFDGQYMYSDVDAVQGHGFSSDANYAPNRTWLHRFSLDYLDKKLDISDLGFIGRNDAIVFRYGAVRTQTRGLKSLRRLRSSLFFSNQWSTDGFANRIGVFTNQTLALMNRSELKLTVNYFPEQWDDRNSRGNGMFKIEERLFGQIAYGTDTAKLLSFSGALTAEQESLGDWTNSADVGFTFKPSGRFSLDFDLNYKERDGWLVHRSGRNFTTYGATEVKPKLAADFFFNARHQLRLTLQWAGIRTEDQAFFEVPLSEGPLVSRAVQPILGSEDFTISRLTAQLRYRWEIGPLSDLFLVYTRGGNLPNQVDSEFDDLFSGAFDEPIVDVIVMKIRYRFGL